MFYDILLKTLFLKDNIEVYNLKPELQNMSYKDRQAIFKQSIMEVYLGCKVELCKETKLVNVGFDRSSIMKKLFLMF